MKVRVMRTTLVAILTVGALCGGLCEAATGPVGAADSAAALYNAGNAQARSGHPALAVLDYERARLLAPADPDIAANLRHVRESVGLSPQTGGWLQGHQRFASPNTMYWLGLLGILCTGISLVSLRALRPRRTYRTPLQTTVIFGAFLTLVSMSDALATDSLLHEYVVLNTSPATGSPVSNGTPMFTVSQADVVQVHQQHKNFLLVTDSQGRRGWVSGSQLEAIVPHNGDASPGE